MYFVSFLFSALNPRGGFNTNSIGSYFKNLRKLLKYCIKFTLIIAGHALDTLLTVDYSRLFFLP